jgi:ankyrin repeat protein
MFHRLDINGQYDKDIINTIHAGPYRKADTVRLLLRHGADVEAQDESHSTPLHMASSLGIPEIVQLLIEHGSDVNIEDCSHRTPLHHASSWVSVRTTLLLI